MVDKLVKFAEVELFNDEIEEMGKVLASGAYINGPSVMEFEELFAEAVGAEFCAGMGSGTAALQGAIEACLQNSIPFEERYHYGIIVPAFSFFATASAVKHCNFTPVYVDTDKHGLMNLEQAHDALVEYGDKIVGMIPVHMFGQVMKLPVEFTMNADIFVIEDACQAYGAYTKVQGDMAAFSFYPAKNLGAAGDAGCVVTDDYDLAIYAKSWANYGDLPGTKYNHAIELGTNNRLDTIQAALLAAKLKSETRKQAQEYRENVAKEYLRQEIETMCDTELPNSWHLYPVSVAWALKEQLRKLFTDRGIQVGNHYPYLLPDKIEGWNRADGYEQASLVAASVMTLPIGPHMSFVDIDRVVKTMRDYRAFEADQVTKLVNYIGGGDK